MQNRMVGCGHIDLPWLRELSFNLAETRTLIRSPVRKFKSAVSALVVISSPNANLSNRARK
jgi:hypothetical protein